MKTGELASHWTKAGALVGALVCLLGCGTLPGSGERREQGMLPARWTGENGQAQEVPFSFEAQSDIAGTMFTTLGKGGEHFRGRYVRIEKSTEGHLVTEVCDGFSSPEWEVWDHDPDGGWTETGVSYVNLAEAVPRRKPDL